MSRDDPLSYLLDLDGEILAVDRVLTDKGVI